MKKAIVLIIVLAACGYSSKGNELVGQVKKVVDVTPLVCGDYTLADVSLGVLRDGNGSMSREDVDLVVTEPAHRKLLKEAAENGRAVKIEYNVVRVNMCWPDHRLVSVRYLDAEAAAP